MKLKSFSFFQQTLSPNLARIDQKLRPYVLIALYSRAAQARDLETLRDNEKRLSKALRAKRIGARRVRAHIKNALKCIAMAREAAESLMHPELNNATFILKALLADVTSIEQVSAAGIHPDLRTERERMATADVSVREWLHVDGFGVAKIDHWMIESIDRYLESVWTTGGFSLRSADINRIIVAVFAAAFGETCELGRVKTARRRLRKKRSPKS